MTEDLWFWDSIPKTFPVSFIGNFLNPDLRDIVTPSIHNGHLWLPVTLWTVAEFAGAVTVRFNDFLKSVTTRVNPWYHACKVNSLPTQPSRREKWRKKRQIEGKKEGIKKRDWERKREREYLLPQLLMVLSQKATVCTMLVY